MVWTASVSDNLSSLHPLAFRLDTGISDILPRLISPSMLLYKTCEGIRKLEEKKRMFTTAMMQILVTINKQDFGKRGKYAIFRYFELE